MCERFERFFDGLLLGHGAPEDLGGKIGDGLPALQRRGFAAGNHGGAGADTDEVGGGAAFLEAADEHGDIGALATAVGVQLVENEKAHPVRPGRHHGDQWERSEKNFIGLAFNRTYI